MAKTRKKKQAGKKKITASRSGPPRCSPAPDPQGESKFFQLLPQELRDNICTHLWSSTRLAYGLRATARIGRIRIKPAPNALALLQTCRRAKMENEEVWIGQVLPSFEDPETMLDKLTSLPLATLSKLRKLRIVGDPLLLSYGYDDVFYRLSSTLALLPGLRLDTLTVLGTRTASVSYQTLDRLIEESRGWKELRYICHSSEILAFERSIPFWAELDEDERHWYWRKPQPAHWQTLLEERDGYQSKPSVVIYRSIVPDSPNSVLHTNIRVSFEQKVPKDEEARAFGITQDAGLMADGEKNKELMIIVKRGTGIDYEQKKDSPLLEIDIRRDVPGKTWKEIRYECIDRLTMEDDDFGSLSSDDDDDRYPVEVDAYDDADRYTWPPLHFMTD